MSFHWLAAVRVMRAGTLQVFTNAIQCLSEEDRGLEPIGHFLPILKRGIAVHHSGLLPLLKELVELLFQEGLIKVRSAIHRSPPPPGRLSQGQRTDTCGVLVPALPMTTLAQPVDCMLLSSIAA
jgi:hypothetical protein